MNQSLEPLLLRGVGNSTFDEICSSERTDLPPGSVFATLRDGYSMIGAINCESNSPCSPLTATSETPIRLGCSVKPITATLAAIAIENGLITYEDEIADYFPLDSATQKALEGITVLHCLHHTHGLDGDRLFMENPEPGKFRVEEALRYANDRPRLSAPGEIYAYSSFGFCIIGALLEEVTGLSFEELLASWILGPLEIPFRRSSAAGGMFNAARNEYVPTAFHPTGPVAAVGGDLAMTAMDWLRFLPVHFGHREEILSTNGATEMLAKAICMPGGGEYATAAGVGWTYFSTGTWGHNGMNCGHQVFVRFIPEKSFAAVLLCPSFPAFQLANKIMGDNYRSSPVERPAIKGTAERPPSRFSGVYRNGFCGISVAVQSDYLELTINWSGGDEVNANVTQAIPDGNGYRLWPTELFGYSKIWFIERNNGGFALSNGAGLWVT